MLVVCVCVRVSEEGAYVESWEELDDGVDEGLTYTFWGSEVGAFAGC